MSIFKKLFGQSDSKKAPKINLRVWVNQAAKEKACVMMAQADRHLLFIAWSKVTSQHFQEVFRKQHIPNEVMTADDILPYRMTGRSFVFIERHFDLRKETIFLESLKAKEVLVHVSLSDPLLLPFNSERIQQLMKQIGHDEEEYIEHDMINKSIENAMKKIKSGDFPKDSSKELLDWKEGIG